MIPKKRFDIPPAIFVSLWGSHCLIKSARAGSLAIIVTPKANLPRNSARNVGAQPCTNINNAPRNIVTETKIFGRYLEVHQLRTIISVRLAQNGAELRIPCSLGDNSISSVIDGSKIPIVFATKNPAVLHATNVEKTTHL